MEKFKYEIENITPTYYNKEEQEQANKAISMELILHYIDLEKLGKTS